MDEVQTLDSMTKARLGEALRRLRRGLMLTQVKVSERARELGWRLGAEQISKWEKGRGWPTLPSLVTYLTAMGRDFVDLQRSLSGVEAGWRAESGSGALGGHGREEVVVEGEDRRSRLRAVVMEALEEPRVMERIIREVMGGSERRLDRVNWPEASLWGSQRYLPGELIHGAGDGNGVAGITEENDRILELLRAKIRAAGVTQLEIQEKYGWGRSYISQILTKQKSLRVEQLLRILKAIDVSLGEFVRELYDPRQRDGDGRSEYHELKEKNRCLTARVEELVRVLVDRGLVNPGEIVDAASAAARDPTGN